MSVWVREYDAGHKGGEKAWWIFSKYHGKIKKKRIGPGKEGHKRAILLAEKLSNRLALEEFDIHELPRLTFAAFADTWLETYVAHELRPGTASKYREVMRVHWLPAFGETILADLTRQQVRAQVVTFQKAGFQNNTIRYWLNVLQSCLSAAIDAEHLSHNPAAQSTRGLMRKQPVQGRIIDTFTAPELTALTRAALALGPMTHAMLITLARTGMRISELMGLQVGDLDFERREIYLQRTWGNQSRGPDYHGPLKSGKTRLIDMSQQLHDTLRAYLLSDGAHSWLFPAAHGRPITPNSFYAVHWKPLFKRLPSIKYRHPHVLRHTYATDMLGLGKSPVYVKEQLGHASIKITVDWYGQWIRSWNKEAVDDLDRKQTAGSSGVPPGFLHEKDGLRVLPGRRE